MRKTFIVLLALAALLAALIPWLHVELQARLALDRSNFSHVTYWAAGSSAHRKIIECYDRQIHDFSWVHYFPELEELNLVTWHHNENHFHNLQPLTGLKNLRVLRLSGVGLKSYRDLPVFPNLEEVTFNQSYMSKPSSADLAWLAEAFPKIKSATFTNEETIEKDNKIIFDPTTRQFEFLPNVD
jgi:hypothetical protein